MINQFFAQFTTAELILMGVVVFLMILICYLFFRMKKLSFNYYAKSVSKTVEAQTTKITQLEKQINLYKREGTGVVVEWASTRSDKSSYLLSICNDTAEKIFNLEARIDPRYQMCSKLFWKANQIESQKAISIFFVPGGWTDTQTDTQVDRGTFLRTWLANNLEPIKFTIMYTESPSRSNFKFAEILFHPKQLNPSSKRRLEMLGNLPQLSVVSQDQTES